MSDNFSDKKLQKLEQNNLSNLFDDLDDFDDIESSIEWDDSDDLPITVEDFKNQTNSLNAKMPPKNSSDDVKTPPHMLSPSKEEPFDSLASELDNLDEELEGFIDSDFSDDIDIDIDLELDVDFDDNADTTSPLPQSILADFDDDFDNENDFSTDFDNGFDNDNDFDEWEASPLPTSEGFIGDTAIDFGSDLEDDDFSVELDDDDEDVVVSDFGSDFDDDEFDIDTDDSEDDVEDDDIVEHSNFGSDFDDEFDADSDFGSDFDDDDSFGTDFEDDDEFDGDFGTDFEDDDEFDGDFGSEFEDSDFEVDHAVDNFDLDIDLDIDVKEEKAQKILDRMGDLDEDDDFSSEEGIVYDTSGNPVKPQIDGEVCIQEIPLSAIIIPPRIKKAHRVDELEISISDWGLVTPLHVIPHGEDYVLVHGYRRLMALKNLRHTSAMCIVDTTRPKSIIRFLEVISNNTIPYNFFEIMGFGAFVEEKQKHFKPETIENILGMDQGDYLKAKYIQTVQDSEIIGRIFEGKDTIKSAFKKLEKKLEKEAKEKTPLDILNQIGLPGDEDAYDKAQGPAVNQQKPGEREPLPKWLSDSIKSRDKHTCQCCGAGDGLPELISIFEVHHMVPVRDRGDDSEENLILLCANCHKIIHAYEQQRIRIPSEREPMFFNYIILGNIILKGVPGGYSPYKFYMEKYDPHWLN